MIELAQARRRDSSRPDRLSFLSEDAEGSGVLAAESVDLAICVGAFEHMLNKPVVLSSVRRVLKPRGRFFCLTINGGYVWYRVLAGGYRTRDSAVTVRAALWSRRLAQRGQGDVLRAPYSYAVSGTAAADDLRARGIPALARDGDGRLLVGAFETPEQAGVLEARLKRAGVRATLVTRMGTTP